MRASTKGSQKRARGGTHCRDVRDDSIAVNTNDATGDAWACGPNDVDDDTGEEEGSSHRDETEEVVEKTDQRRGIERWQGSDELEDANDDL